MKMNQRLQDAILDILATSHSLFVEDGGQPFEAVTETDLMAALRDRGWRLPAAGWFDTEVRQEGFKVRQGYQFQAPVRRAFGDGSTGRRLSDCQTIIFI
jgi:hypothetical protein